MVVKLHTILFKYKIRKLCNYSLYSDLALFTQDRTVPLNEILKGSLSLRLNRPPPPNNPTTLK